MRARESLSSLRSTPPRLSAASDRGSSLTRRWENRRSAAAGWTCQTSQVFPCLSVNLLWVNRFLAGGECHRSLRKSCQPNWAAAATQKELPLGLAKRTANCVRRDWHPERKVHPDTSDDSDFSDRSYWREGASSRAVIFLFFARTASRAAHCIPSGSSQEIPARHEAP
jgi:hypothetical protein